VHCVTDKRFNGDPEGTESSSIAEAEAEANQSARDLICDELRRGRHIPSDWRMLIATEDDTILNTIPFFLVAHGGGVPHAPELRRPTRKVNVEREHPSLAETDKLIAKARTHIDAQQMRITILESDGRDTSLATDLLNA